MPIEEASAEDHLDGVHTDLSAERAAEFGRQFRRIATPNHIAMSCFEQIDKEGKALGRVWVSQSVKIDPVE